MVFVALLIGFVFWRALDGSKLNNISKGLCEVIEREKNNLQLMNTSTQTNLLIYVCAYAVLCLYLVRVFMNR